MVFWLAVLVGAFFAWVAVQVGFYATWMMFFNLVLSAYLAIFLSPVIVENVPAATSTPYGYALVFLCIAAATLIIAYALCYAFLSGHLRVEFPKLLDTIAAGVIGFLAGFLVSSFLSLSVALLPLSQMDTLKSLGFEASSQKANTAYVCWWCDLLNAVVSSSETELTSAEAVDMLLTRVALSAEDASQSSGSDASKPGANEAPKHSPYNGPKTGAYGAPASNAYEQKVEPMPPSQPPPGNTATPAP